MTVLNVTDFTQSPNPTLLAAQRSTARSDERALVLEMIAEILVEELEGVIESGDGTSREDRDRARTLVAIHQALR